MTRIPNLFVIGAMKAGSSTLHSILAEHPEIYMSRVKEPYYFVVPDGVPAPGTPCGGDRQAYLQLFAEAGGAKYVGESSPSYTMLPAIQGVAERIRNFNRDSVLIYIMRDPVERSVSHYWWEVWLRGERRSMYEAIRDDSQYTDYSNYAMQLKPYLEHFGGERIHVMTLERLNSDLRGSLEGLYSWLGLEPVFSSAERRENAMPRVLEVPTNGGMLHRLRFSKFWSVAGRFAPKRLRSFAKKAAYEFIERHDVTSDRAKEHLRAMQLEQVEELSSLLGRSFPEWKTLYGSPGRDGTNVLPNAVVVPAHSGEDKRR